MTSGRPGPGPDRAGGSGAGLVTTGAAGGTAAGAGGGTTTGVGGGAAGSRYSPGELARMARTHPPTAEQAGIIRAPLAPLLVVAGAGSGKTETMAARICWLVANNQVRADQVLGLTFTRKAAGELAHRIRSLLGNLHRHLGRDETLAGEPTVATYHSYAARVLTEHGLRAGFEPVTRLLTEASRWQLVSALVRAYDGDMSAVSAAPGTVTDAVLHLAAELAEHLVDEAELAAWTGRLHAQVTARPGRTYREVAEVLSRQRARLQLLPLVRAYARRKRDLEAIDFGDQLTRAATVARGHPEVGAIERDRYRVVLLDEYQDTSHAQVVLLRALFGGGHPVTAVGDPCQSIYGWRGASAGTLDRFPAEFPDRTGRPAAVRQLATSWRNRPEILRVANALSQPLRTAGHRVTELAAATTVAPRAGRHTVRCALLPTYKDEAAWIADRILAAWRNAATPATGGATGDPASIPVDRRPTTAVLIRARAQIPPIEAALRARGLPVDVVGLGGLLDTPEVRDVVSTLRVLSDPTDGSALVRLLTGPRWRVGPRDLVALHSRARALAADRRDGAGDQPRSGDRLAAASLVEALDDLGPPTGYSAEGHRRFAELAEELRGLRGRLDQPLPELICDVERVTGLEVEVAARPGDAGLARAHLDALGETAARFANDAEGATLAGFLAYLEAAEAEERGLPAGEVEVVQGAVQILTTHAAKGLEWDVVAVAGLTAGLFPAAARSSDHYLRGIGVLPFPLRGDRAGLPEFQISGAGDQKEVRAALAAFTDAWRAHDEREERRLAYVAVTRPRRLLLCSGYWWGEGGKRPRGPSAFLDEIRVVCRSGAGAVDVWTPPPAPEATNPTAATPATASWPGDPLGGRRAELTRAAALVVAARDRLAAGPPGAAGLGPDPGAAGLGLGAGPTRSGPDPGAIGPDPDPVVAGWAREVDLLLAERAAQADDPGAPVPVVLPGHLSVSQLVALRRDPVALARTLRRPMPTRPHRAARRGTAFHAWLEHRYQADELLDLDDLPGAADAESAPDDDLAELRAAFERSGWARRVPVRVELPFAVTVAGLVIRGRMDAVFADPDGGYDVVDWKTGRQPPPGPDADAVAVQLATYRLAWAELAGVPLSRVRAAFHYVSENRTVRPADLLDRAGLTQLLAGVPNVE